MLKNIHKYITSLEDFAESSTEVEDKPVETVDATNVEASAEPESDVVEAGDELAQATPTEEVKPDGDLETVEEPLAGETSEEPSGIPEPMATTNESAAEAAAAQAEEAQAAEVKELTEQAEQIQATQQETVEAAAADAEAIEANETDVNGNTVPAEDTTGEQNVDITNSGDAGETELTNDVESLDTETTVDDGGETATADTIGEEPETPVEEVEETSEAEIEEVADVSDAAPELDNTEPATVEGGETQGGDEELPELEPEAQTEANDQVDGVSTPEVEEGADEVTVPEVEESIAETTEEEVSEDVAETEEVNEEIAEDSTDDIPAEETPVEEQVTETEESTVEEIPAEEEPVVEETEVEEETPAEVEETPEEDIVNEEETPVETEAEVVDEQVEDQSESTDETTDVAEDEPVLEEIEEDEPDGEIDDDGEANFDEGELDIEDVDTDVTEDDVAEAVKEADEAEEEADADEEEAIDASRTIEDLQKEKESVEGFMEILKYGLSQESYSVQTLILSQVKLDELKKAFGDYAPSVPSMEQYGKEDLDKYYAASLESFRGFLSRITGLKRALNEKLIKWWEGPLVTKVKKRSQALNKDVDLALTKLGKSNIGRETVKGISSDMATKETNLVQAVAKDLRVTSEIAVKGVKDSERALQEVVGVINKAVTEGGYDKTGPLVKTALNIKPAKYPENMANALMGGWAIEYEKGPRGGDSKIEALAYTLVPVFKKIKVEDRQVSFDVTKADLANMLKMAKAYVALADKLADSVGSKAIDDIINLDVTRNRALSTGSSEFDTTSRASGWDEQAELDDLASAMLKVSYAHVDAYKFVTQHALDVADGIVSVVRKAL